MIPGGLSFDRVGYTPATGNPNRQRRNDREKPLGIMCIDNKLSKTSRKITRLNDNLSKTRRQITQLNDKLWHFESQGDHNSEPP